MAAFVKLIDVVLFVMFAITAVIALMIYTQFCLPQSLFPNSLVELKDWYLTEFEDYLGAEKPHFFVGLVWIELVFQWPILLANLYGYWTSKPWYKTTCLVYGASFFTTMGAIFADLLGSGKASSKMLMLYYPAMGYAFLAILRGLLPPSTATPTTGKGPKRTTPPKNRKMM